MKSSIYISSEKIEVVGYAKRGKGVYVKAYAECPLPEGVVINGKIIEQHNVIDSIAGLRRKKRGLFTSPSLILDGTVIQSKRIAAPKLSKKRYYQLVEDEFADSAENFDEMVYDYSLLTEPKSSQTAILACATDRALIESCTFVFKQAGVRLKAIKIGIEAVQNYVRLRPDLQKSAIVINIIDGVTMLSMIFQEGVNVFITRTRLYGESPEQLVHSVLDSLSGIIQFNTSQKFNEITHSYYLGLSADNLRLLDAFNPHAGIAIEKLGTVGKVKKKANIPEDIHFAYLSALLGKGGIDLIESCRTVKRLEKSRRPKKRWIPALAIIAALLATPVIYMYTLITDLEKSAAELRTFISEPSRTEKSAELDEITSGIGYYSNISGQLDGKLRYESSLTRVSNQVLDLITQTHSEKVTIDSFDFNEKSGFLRAEATSATETDSARYVDALKQSNLVDDVKYRGYSYNDKGEYSFTFDVILAGETSE